MMFKIYKTKDSTVSISFYIKTQNFESFDILV